MAVNVNWRKARKQAQRAKHWPEVQDRVFAELGISRDDLAAFDQQLQGKDLACVMPGMPSWNRDRMGQGISPYISSPLLIIYCETVYDVWIAMKLIHDHDWEFTCRSGGHSTAGFSVNNSVVLDLSGLNDITVDRETLVAQVGVGSTFDRLNSTLRAFGVHVPTGGCGDVGVGGFIQGGGFGFTSRQFGMMCDCARSFLVMLWDGRIVEASADKNPDLFWAVRGGTGNNFGVVLQVTLALVDIPEMWGFVLVWDKDDAPRALHEMQSSYMKGSPHDSIGYMAAITTSKDDPTEPVVLLAGICTEGREAGLAAIQSLRAVGSPELIFDKTEPYPALDPVLLNALPGVPSPLDKTFEVKDCGYVADMIDQNGWEKIFQYFVDNLQANNPYSIVFIEPYGGAINGVAPEASAFIHRDTYMDIYLDSFWQDGTDFTDYEAAKKWLEGYMDVLTPFMNGHKYQNYPQRDMADFRYTYWGEYYNSLLFVKNKYDPNNVFRFEQSISPFPKEPGVRTTDKPSMFSAETITYEPWSRSFVGSNEG